MGLHNDEYKTLEVMLTGSNNRTLKGVLNFTAMDLGGYSEEDEVYDGTGAATFVIVVILVYGLSIVLMIGSLAKKNMKLKDIDLEEKQIHQYLSQANDLREKGAKENYRQLKRTIITLVNNIPDGEDNKKKDATSVSSNILRSMVAVGSPVIASLADQKPDSDKEGETSGNPPSRVIRSDSESLQALLEEDEDISDDAQTSYGGGQPRQCVVSHRERQSPKTTVVKSTGSSPRFIRSELLDARRSPSTVSKAPPRVVVSSLREARNRHRPGSATASSGDLLSPLEKDNKIIYKLDDRLAREGNKSCKLSMDSEGNIWILQASPEAERRSTERLTPSPALPSPRSLGYESLCESRTPSPNVFATLSPPSGAGIAASTPTSSPKGSPRSGRDQPRARASPQRDRSRSPIDPSRSPTAAQSPSVCCEHKHNLILKSTANILPSGRKSPYHEPRDPGVRDLSRTDPVASRNDVMTNMATPVVLPASIPVGPDEEELVQITTV